MVSLKDIQIDNRSGASELLTKAAQFLKPQIQRLRDAEDRRRICMDLVVAQPRMAPMIHLANRVIHSNGDRAELLQSIDHFLESRKQSMKTIQNHAAALIRPNSRVGIYSRSSLVMQCLKACAEHVTFSVAVCESRPMLEGRTAAQELTHAGVPVTMMIDAAFSVLTRNSDIILIGADSISPAAVTNKIGSRPLCLIAKADDTPVYCIITPDKFIPDNLQQPPEPAHNPAEIWETDLSLNFETPYFESFPPELLTGLVTDAGVITASDIQKHIPDIHPDLKLALANLNSHQ
ncbi:MAG: hypothetical protein U5R06_17110 [candidate division KSB1 bacterium]|nr:hypothetical protein [candidate division KSB1 bacterium]